MTEPQRQSEGGRHWVSTSIDRLSREIDVQLDDAHERWWHKEHVLDIWSTQHVLDDRDGCFVAENTWLYSQEYYSAKWRCLGSIILLDFSLILVSLLKMLALKYLILSVKVCESI